ncbi:MAG: uracil-DNA glycosylase family protein [Verrucomicrobiota bacterium]
MASSSLAQSLESHLTALRACRRCANMHAPPIANGPVKTRLLIVGQAPGVREPELQRPFAWTAGKTLFKWFQAASGIDEAGIRERVYFAAVCRCFPGKSGKGSGDRVPDGVEIENCSRWMQAEFDLLQPQLVIPIGKLAISQFLKFGKLTEVIGGMHSLEKFGHRFDLIPLPHPSGVSTWHNREPGKSLLSEAMERVANHPVFVDEVVNRQSRGG